MMDTDNETFDAWDPLEASAGVDPGLLISAQRREISNILRSYTGYYDLFAELIQNALDAVEKRGLDEDSKFQRSVWVDIDLQNHTVRVTDNGCAMDLDQLRQFLRPSFSFKSGAVTRGSKGVGATYLGYGFNHLEISTRLGGKTYSGLIEGGRQWVDDKTGTVARPKIVSCSTPSSIFSEVDQGTSIAVRLKGPNIRPKSLSWNQATTADQWMALIRVLTPIGGLYLNGSAPPDVNIAVSVTDAAGVTTEASIERPEYLFPHTVIGRSGNLDEFIFEQNKRISQGNDPSKVLPKFKSLNGLWGQWTNQELLREVKTTCPINLSLDASEKALAKDAGLSVYVYMAFSTELWDALNDKTLKLRKGARTLHGGLQLSTRNMPQGMTLTIPMTNNIGFQNLAHIVVHFENAEPDLGRKGFQPEYVHLAEKVAVSAVTAFRKKVQSSEKTWRCQDI